MELADSSESKDGRASRASIRTRSRSRKKVKSLTPRHSDGWNDDSRLEEEIRKDREMSLARIKGFNFEKPKRSKPKKDKASLSSKETKNEGRADTIRSQGPEGAISISIEPKVEIDVDGEINAGKTSNTEVPSMIEAMDGVEESNAKRKANDTSEDERSSEDKKLKTATGLDRVKGGKGDVYIVCEDIRNKVRATKTEATNKEIMMESKATIVEHDLNKCSAEEVDSVTESRMLTEELRKYVLSDANKLSKHVANIVLDQAARYEKVIQRLAVENAYLRGRADALNGIGGVVGETAKAVERVGECLLTMTEGMEGLRENVRKAKESIERFESCERIRENSMDKEPKKSYALVLKSRENQLSSEEVQKKMFENVGTDLNVRVKAVRPVKGGGVLVQTASFAERDLIASHQGIQSAGLIAERPRPLDPRVIIFGVPEDIPNETVLKGVYLKSLQGLMDEKTFFDRVKVFLRFGKKGEQTAERDSAAAC